MAIRRGTEEQKTAQITAQPTLRKPRTGKGMLLTGGKPGNSGGKKGRSGRTPEAIRASLRLDFVARVKVWHEIADDPTQDANVRIKAVELLAKYGLGTTFTETGDDGKAVPRGIKVRYIQPPTDLLPDRIAKALNGNGQN